MSWKQISISTYTNFKNNLNFILIQQKTVKQKVPCKFLDAFLPDKAMGCRSEGIFFLS
jgi:hypothetical protein